ncbi:glycosyltransferase [Streptomyces syringium]
MNDRPTEFAQAMASLLAQEGVDLDVVVVGNGCEPEHVPPGVRTVALPENLGIPEGRNVGAAHVKGDLLLFFDNDAILPQPDITARLAARLRKDPDLAYVQPRIADPDTGVPLRRWVPRLRAADAARPGTVTVMYRVWLARRNLPRVLIPAHLAVWALLTLWRVNDRKALRTSMSFREGLRTDCGTRAPMSWRTVARLTRAGRPPIF